MSMTPFTWFLAILAGFACLVLLGVGVGTWLRYVSRTMDERALKAPHRRRDQPTGI